MAESAALLLATLVLTLVVQQRWLEFPWERGAVEVPGAGDDRTVRHSRLVVLAVWAASRGARFNDWQAALVNGTIVGLAAQIPMQAVSRAPGGRNE